MSLNGLDDAAVTGAYQAALAEAGGWFLLRYVSRDAVEVLSRGTRGATEARAAVAQYEEKSPLYGFLLYRRRKVLIKYTPEGTSRLLQARVAVHFTAVSEKFTPHDITMAITSADELSDSALASACSLHTAAPSTCSSNSSRRKLDEIAEDAEEGAGNGTNGSLERPSTPVNSKPAVNGSVTIDIPADVVLPSSPPALTSPVSPSRSVKKEPSSTLSPDPKAMPGDSSDPKPTAIRKSLQEYDDLFKYGLDPRLSSQTTRPSMADMYAEIYEKYNKPKVKLGPRPKVSLDGKRPQTAGTRVSTLPAGMRKANSRKHNDSKDTITSETNKSTTSSEEHPPSNASSLMITALPAVPPIPEFSVPVTTPSIIDLPLKSAIHPPKSPSSVRSMTLPGYPRDNPRSKRITPEKQRLMKAVEMRKKQLQAQQEREKQEAADKDAAAGAAAELAAELVRIGQKDARNDAVKERSLTIGGPDPTVLETLENHSSDQSAATGRKHTRSNSTGTGPSHSLDSNDGHMHTHFRNKSTGTKLPHPRYNSGVLQDLAPLVIAVPGKEPLLKRSNAVMEKDPHSPKSPKSKISDKPPQLDEPPLSTTPIEVPGTPTASVETAQSNILPTGTKVASPVVDSAVDMGDDIYSAASASSPTTAQTQLSSAAPSTRPSSLSDDERLATALPQKIGDCTAETLWGLEAPELWSRAGDRESVQSTPTVVPESATPVPSVEVTPQVNISLAGASASEPNPRAETESTIHIPPAEPVAKRQSVIYTPTDIEPKADAALSKRAKRESMVLSVPKRRSFINVSEKRKSVGDRNSLYLNGDHPEEYMSDDSFIDELHTATLHQAKPIQVSKSPVTAFFPRKPSTTESERPTSRTASGLATGPALRSVSQPASQQPRQRQLSPDQGTGRKLSGVWPPQSNNENVSVAKKITVSSGISQRIKALAEKSKLDSGAVSPLATPDASASVAHRKSSFFSTPSPVASPGGKLANRASVASFANASDAAAPNRQPAPQFTPFTVGVKAYALKQTTEKPDASVQVTARIVRDGRPLNPTLTMPTDTTPLELNRSQITINRQPSTATTSLATSPVKTYPQPAHEPTSPRSPSVHSKEQSISAPRSSSESSWRTFGRRLSESKTGASARSLSAHSSESEGSSKKEKKDSRTSKLFKRMSAMSSAMSRKTQTGPDEERGSTTLASVREPPAPVQIGDLNVQFPDTLLWKRRWVEVDATGNLVLSMGKPGEQSKGLTKRFHLTEFRTPYAPDQDQQELAHSVVFDFIDGRTLQCACETYAAQKQVLQVIKETHEAWIAYNQAA
ncbi:hypothetical protein M011DRAFT_528051 [Sporormia fimetaria CBS 119925]|uniref:ADF-H domain-containing protein n=1 Tax=Sporormia fimetaria CBS 119925 TaxID=1340428 RepID=A0A6A6V5K4_9PLEO|nr:hypothetical protein M011DRAFT_528051 [Sporormia fimetaria CBS 119925]